ncbi:MAG: DNA recombination protein RmuC [Clostridia bacterium]|nr:DNA recombination protein RmuC [Clostridia bacterium]
MGLIEILAILILIGVLAAVALLVVLLLRKKPDPAADPEAIAAVTARALADTLRREVTEPILREERNSQSTLRTEMQTELRGSRTETVSTVQNSVDKLGQSLRESQKDTAELQARRISELTAAETKLMAELSDAQNRRFEAQDARLEAMQKSLNALLSERMDGLNTTVGQRLSEVEKQFKDFREQSAAAQELLRKTMEERMTVMQTANSEKLEQMRATVDEKLQKTLDERISQSFKAVNDRLADVYKGLGEMQTLAGDVGDLKKVMAGVKTRGILGEIQLGAIISEMLSPEQYEENIVTRPGTANRVEFAIRLPGEGDIPVYLPIDAKFPADAYHHLVDAYEAGDPDAIKAASSELETRIKGAAKDIRDKYVEPPYTTTFGIMFLPFEGLYAEVVRMGLVDVLQTQYRVSVAGPTTLAALLNSLQMGFRTLAIQKRSGEVWEVLGAVKTEFGNFEKVLAKAKERIDQTGDELDKLIGTRTRQINRKLKSVAELPAADAQKLLDGVIAEEDS